MVVRNVGELVEGRSLVSTAGDTAVADVCKELRRCNIGVLAVLDDGRLTGIISERDVITRVVAAGRDPQATTVGDVMTPEPVTVATDAGVIDALECMLDGGFRHLPVMKDDAPVGMISMRDIPTENRFLYQRFLDARQNPPALAEARQTALVD